MSVRKAIPEHSGIHFCHDYLSRVGIIHFSLTDGYDVVYRWFDYLKSQGICSKIYYTGKPGAYLVSYTALKDINLIKRDGEL